MRLDDEVWPLVSDPRDPFAEPWPDDDLGYADHVASPVVETRPESAYRPAALALQAALDALDRGEDPGRPLDALCAEAAVPLTVRWDSRPVPLAPFVLPAEVLALEALDTVPDVGQRAPHAILGPWRLVWHPTTHRRTYVHAIAQWATSGPGRSPAQRWTRSKRAPDREVRAAARAIWQAPLGVFRALDAGEGRFRLEDRLGLDPRRVPDGPVSLDLADRAVSDGDVLLARAVPTKTDWVAWAPLVLPGDPDDDVLATLHRRALVRVRLRRRQASFEDALRDGARWFARRVLTSCLPPRPSHTGARSG